MTVAAGESPALNSPHAPLELSRIRAALAPTLRAEGQEAANSATRQAAVALVLREEAFHGDRPGTPAVELLLIRRAEQRDDPWSGHMALPGGRRDPTDAHLLQTARREAREEVGLELETVGSLIGRLSPVPAVAQGRPVGLTIVPFVFQLTGKAPLQVNHEVAEALWVPLDRLRSGQVDTFIEYPMSGRLQNPLRLPAWALDGRIVWGLTHQMISMLFNLLERAAQQAQGLDAP